MKQAPRVQESSQAPFVPNSAAAKLDVVTVVQSAAVATKIRVSLRNISFVLGFERMSDRHPPTMGRDGVGTGSFGRSRIES